MKYLLVLLAILSASCSHKAQPKVYICFNPTAPIASFQIETNSPRVKDLGDSLQLSFEEGDLILPKSLCAEMRLKKVGN